MAAPGSSCMEFATTFAVSRFSRDVTSVLRRLTFDNAAPTLQIAAELGRMQTLARASRAAHSLLPPSHASTAATARGLASAYERQHREVRTVPFSAREVYAVVADVDSYADFVPWCTESLVTDRADSLCMIARLSVGFRALSESYSSVVTLDPGRSVKVDVPRSNLFDYLVNDWTFKPLCSDPDEKMSELSFHLRFAFRNPLYQQATDLFFEQVARQMVSAFEGRCHRLYGSRKLDASLADACRTRHTDIDRPERTDGVMHRW